MNMVDAIKLISWSNKDNAAAHITHFANDVYDNVYFLLQLKVGSQMTEIFS